MDDLQRSNTIPLRIKYWATKQPHKECFIFRSENGCRRVLTSLQLYELSVQFAHQLKEIGVHRGDIVCNLIHRGPESYVAFFGTLAAGCSVQNAGVQISDGRYLLENLNKTKANTIVLSSDKDDQAARVISQYFDTVSQNNVKCSKLPHLKYVIYTNTTIQEEGYHGFSWSTKVKPDERGDEIKKENNNTPEPEYPNVDDEAVIMPTSGTTGTSKLISLSHRFCMRFGVKLCEFSNVKLSNAQPVFDPSPISWIWGIPFMYLVSGWPHVYPIPDSTDDTSQNAVMFRDIICKEKCTSAKLSVFTMFQLLKLKRNDQVCYTDWPLRRIFTGGQPIQRSIFEIIGNLADTIYNFYGSTETGLNSVKKIDHNTVFEDYNTGHIFDDVMVRIVDGNMKPVSKGTYGELQVKSPVMFTRYVADETLTRTSFTPDGWFQTRDDACLTEGNELLIRGRSDMVIMRGMNYYHPAWIETIIRQCPQVLDVVVVKVPDKLLSFEICACVIPRDPNDNITSIVEEFCSKSFIVKDPNAKSARPKFYLKMTSFPTNRNGKLDRKKLEEIAKGELNINC